MRNISAYEENTPYGLHFPIRVARLAFPPGDKVLFYPHWHREFEFFFVTEGVAVFTVDGMEHRVSKGECVFVPPESFHSAAGESGAPCKFLAVVFYGTAICGEEGSAAYEKYISPVLDGMLSFRVFFAPTGGWVNEVLGNLWDIEQIPPEKLPDNELLLKGKLCEIWSLCFVNSTEIMPEKEIRGDKLRVVLEYIQNHYSEDLSLERLANLMPLSVGQFCRVFRQRVNMTPVAYVNRHRILQSCRLLDETKRSITDIANRTGFNNISYFNKVFRRAVGCTPSVYRKSRS